MFGQKVNTSSANGATNLAIRRRRFPRNVQFGIEPQAPIVHIGRADTQETVIHQEKLRVNIGSAFLAIASKRSRMINAERVPCFRGDALQFSKEFFLYDADRKL